MNLHQEKQLYSQVVRATADRLQIPEIYIEKDYWVCFALKLIFDSGIDTNTVFKGGTALSKCFGIIERFSEDIDLVIASEEDISDNQRKNKLKFISTLLSGKLPEIEIEGVTIKKGMNRKTVHTYRSEFTGDPGQMRDHIVVEASWLGSSEPWVEADLKSYIADTLTGEGLMHLVRKHNLTPFKVKCLAPERTICEKILSLVRFSYSDDPIAYLKLKIRHCYDLYCLLHKIKLKTFFNSERFDSMLRQVGQDDLRGYRSGNSWIKIHPSKALVFSKVDEVWGKLLSTYENEFSKMVYGELPAPGMIRETLSLIFRRIENINWIMNPEK